MSEGEGDGEEVTLHGVITRMRIHDLSRSAHDAPLLVDADSHYHRLHLIGDNPFEQPTLAALEGKRVTVTGHLRNGVLRVARERLLVDE